MSRAANFPELVNDKVELHALLVGWHDNIGHALLSALGSPESVLIAVQEHETDREIVELKSLTDVLYVANKIANRKSSWRDPGWTAWSIFRCLRPFSMPTHWKKSLTSPRKKFSR